MTTLTLENVPDDLVELLKRSAERHGRSLSVEAVDRLRQSVSHAAQAETPFDSRAFLTRLDELHGRLRLPWLTDEFLEWAIEEGRE